MEQGILGWEKALPQRIKEGDGRWNWKVKLKKKEG